MSNVLVLLTSERCGHCRNMRGSGRLLSQTEIKRDNKQPNIPGGNHYDAVFMKKLITAEVGNTAKLRVINIHYKTFNPAEIENTTYKSNLSYILFGKVKCKYESNMFIDGDNKADFLKITSQNIVKQIPQNTKVVTNNDVIPDFDMNDL